MNDFYFIVSSILFALLFLFLRQRNNTTQKIIKPHDVVKPIMPTKNKWLYTTDSFGKMEKGVVHYSESYTRETMVRKRHSAKADQKY